MAESNPLILYNNIGGRTIKQVNAKNTTDVISLKCEIIPIVTKRKPATRKILFNTSNISEKLISTKLSERTGINPLITHRDHPKVSVLYRECFDSINKSIETPNPTNRMKVRMRRLKKTSSCNFDHLLSC